MSTRLPITPFLRTAYNYDADKASDEAGISFEGEKSLTQQNFAEECDINTIVKRFGLTGQLPDNIRLPEYGDFTQVLDFQTAMNAVRSAEESFMLLPAEVRYRFANDPQRLLEFVADPSNKDEAARLGLLVKPVEVARDGSALPVDKPV